MAVPREYRRVDTSSYAKITRNTVSWQIELKKAIYKYFIILPGFLVVNQLPQKLFAFNLRTLLLYY